MVLAEGPFEVIVAGPEASSEVGLHRLRKLRARAPNTKLLLVFDKWPTQSLRDTVRTGAVDILRLPVTDKALQESLELTIEVAMKEGGSAGHDPDHPAKDATVIAIVSATGGCGKTFFATNLAYFLEAKSDRRTCLVDLDLQFGELTTALRLKPRTTIADFIAQPDDAAASGNIADHLVRHDTGFHVLAAPDEPDEADAVAATDVAKVIEAARSGFEFVILDTAAALSESVLVALEHADVIFALATLDLPSVRNLGVMLSVMRKLKVPADQAHLVLNKLEPDGGMDLERVSRYFPQGFSMVIPYGSEVNRALNMGMPMLAFAPASPVSKALTAGLARAISGFGDEPAEPKRHRRARARRRNRPA